MTDRPILFSAPMVRALLAGTKTQTRRVTQVVKPDGDNFIVSNAHGGVIGVEEADVPKWGPDFVNFDVGDRLWVREAWRTGAAYDTHPPRAIPNSVHIACEADEDRARLTGKLRPGMFMPRWASRLTLAVTEVRVQRLQDCGEADAIAEGVVKCGRFWGVAEADWDCASLVSPVDAYANLWDFINGGGAWDANPWIVAVSFTVHYQNIDALQEAA